MADKKKSADSFAGDQEKFDDSFAGDSEFNDSLWRDRFESERKQYQGLLKDNETWLRKNFIHTYVVIPRKGGAIIQLLTTKKRFLKLPEALEELGARCQVIEDSGESYTVTHSGFKCAIGCLVLVKKGGSPGTEEYGLITTFHHTSPMHPREVLCRYEEKQFIQGVFNWTDTRISPYAEASLIYIDRTFASLFREYHFKKYWDFKSLEVKYTTILSVIGGNGKKKFARVELLDTPYVCTRKFERCIVLANSISNPIVPGDSGGAVYLDKKNPDENMLVGIIIGGAVPVDPIKDTNLLFGAPGIKHKSIVVCPWFYIPHLWVDRDVSLPQTLP